MDLSEVIDRVMPLSQKVQLYYQTELPKYHPNYPLITLEEPNPPPLRRNPNSVSSSVHSPTSRSFNCCCL